MSRNKNRVAKQVVVEESDITQTPVVEETELVAVEQTEVETTTEATTEATATPGEEQKPVVPEKWQISKITKAILEQGRKDRATVIKEALQTFNEHEQKLSIKNALLTEASVGRLMNAMLADIKFNDGAGKRGWWSEWVVEESKEVGKESIKIVPKVKLEDLQKKSN